MYKKNVPPLEDKISETETYSKGRFLLIVLKPGGKVLIDFNIPLEPVS